MSDSFTEMRFTTGDLARWVEKGLITPEQAEEIRAEAVQYADEQPATEAVIPKEQKPGLNMVTVAYYFGGFVVLFGYTLFMGMRWQSLGYTLQFVVSIITLLALWGIGYALRGAGYPQAGGLLVFAGTGITPLVAFTAAQAAGVWPQQPGWDDPGYYNFYETIRPYWVYLEVVSLAVAAVVIWLIRFPLISLLIAFWGWYLSMDLARLIGGNEYNNWGGEREEWVSVAVGVAMLGLGLLLQWRVRSQDYSRWFYFFAHLVLISSLGWLTIDKEGLLGLVFPVTYLGFVLASVWLQSPIFLVFGAVGVYGYLNYLAFRTFGGSEVFPIVLALMGVSIVVSAVLYQRFAAPWLKAHLHVQQPKPPARLQGSHA